ncbi:MAG: FumA C-terminus/TtdB family hydratase beta subunit [Promethearchaeota archaeon]
MTTYHLNLPLTQLNIHDFHIGDIIYLSGIIGTGRDHVHKRICEFIENDESLPPLFSNFHQGAIYHMGPIVKKQSDGKYKIISGGPTTSSRMEPYQERVCKNLEIRFVIGKGGMKNIDWNKINAIYLSFPGGVGAIVSKFISKIISVEWLDFGTPEAVWILKMNHFGPLIVSIDTENQSLY